MKVYIMYEVAGANGYVVSEKKDQYDVRKAVADEVNAAIVGAKEAGVMEFVVNTGYPASDHVDPYSVDPGAQLIRGDWKPDQTMEGMDESFDAQFILSMHAKARTPRAVGAHTWDMSVYDFRVNGKSIGELGMAAYFAAACGVPTVLVSGDTATCKEAHDLLGDIETVATKDSISWVSARCYHPSVVLENMRGAAKRAIERLQEIKPPRLSTPVTVEIEMSSPILIQYWKSVPTVQETGPCGIRYESPDYRAAQRLFLVLAKLYAAWYAESGMPLS
ncbi:MAG: M55 family metallopeptidase [Spirochaetaceae bacterium]|nr:M55 family metallopeptidase [Spirochaetaceae bacterium]